VGETIKTRSQSRLKYFTGWVDPAKLKLLDYATLAELLIAYVDDAHAAGDTQALKILDRRAMAD
jgi:hypothetical protein